jgi:hypothetical protein
MVKTAIDPGPQERQFSAPRLRPADRHSPRTNRIVLARLQRLEPDASVSGLNLPVLDSNVRNFGKDMAPASR